MADKQPVPAKKSGKKQVVKRELRSAARKEGVPILQSQKKKGKFKKWLFGGVGLVVLIIAVAALIPRQGSIRYGICKTFVELNDPYPEYLEFIEVEEIGNLVVLDYNRVDSFGQRSLNNIRCIFQKDATSFALSRVDVNGKYLNYTQESPETIERFNTGLPAILKNKPDLTLPRGLPKNVKDY